MYALRKGPEALERSSHDRRETDYPESPLDMRGGLAVYAGQGRAAALEMLQASL